MSIFDDELTDTSTNNSKKRGLIINTAQHELSRTTSTSSHSVEWKCNKLEEYCYLKVS